MVRNLILMVLLFVQGLFSAQLGNTYSVATDFGYYNSWPVVTTFDSIVCCAYHFGQFHIINSWDDVHLSISYDGGHSWSLTTTPFTGSHTSTPGNRVGYAAGAIHMYKSNNVLRILIAALKEYPDSAIKACSVIKFSDDTGKTWSAEIRIDSTGGMHDANVGVGHICQVHNTGRILIPYFSMINERTVYVTRCDDPINLSPWHVSKVCDSTGGIWPNESNTFELKSNGNYTAQGKILCVMRNDNPPNTTYQSISNDGGLTWSYRTVFPVPFTQTATVYSDNASKLDIIRKGDLIYLAQGIYRGELHQSSTEGQTFSPLSPDWAHRDTSNIFAGYYSSIADLTRNQLGFAWCTNYYPNKSGIYFTTYQLYPDTIKVQYSVKFTLPKFSSQIPGVPIPLNLSKINDINFWNTLNISGSNLQISDSSKTYKIYVDTQTISRMGKKGWLWFKPDILDTIKHSYVLTLGKNISSTNDSSIFTSSHIILSSGFNDPLNPVDTISKAIRLTPQRIESRTKIWYGASGQDHPALYNIPSIAGSQIRLSYQYGGGVFPYINYGDVSSLNGASKLSGWVLATQDTINRNGFLFEKINSISGDRIQIGTNTSDHFFIEMGASNYAHYDYSQKVTSGNPFLLYYEYDGTQSTNANKLKCWINGDSIPLTFVNNVPSNVGDMTGYNLTVSDYGAGWNGTIDDIGLSTVTFGGVYAKALYMMFMQDSVTWGSVNLISQTENKTILKKTNLRSNTRL